MLDREREIFEAAIELEPNRRVDYVLDACRGDAALEDRLRRLLAAHARAENSASNLVSPPAPKRLEDPLTIDNFRILERVGEGGMGVVYLAEQTEPVRRRVALKIIKLGMDTKEVIARFKSERQALALMNHPNIARILNAAATEEGRPYFVMEYVKGIAITDYCDKMRLSIDRRLELFIDVCLAVQHAHQKGVVHRDIKPSNILVSEEGGQPVPKVIDFGVAKATDQRLTEMTLHTRHGFLIGTPQYMSPEQAEMSPLDIDTRSDVYSLGAVLYELLTGLQPLEFDTATCTHAEMQFAIRNAEPVRPGTRLRKLHRDQAVPIAQLRSTNVEPLIKKLRGELGWITGKALEKSPARRYQAAQMLAEDIQRYLQHNPVLAREPSALYRVGKFVRRHAAGVSATVLSFTVIVVLVAFYTYQLTQERNRASRQAATLEQVDRFLIGLFEVSDPGEARGNTITARELLDRGAQRVAEELRDQPEVQASLMYTIGEIYVKLGLYEEAEPLLNDSLSMRREAFGDEHPDVASSLDALGYLLESAGDYDAAEPLLREALNVRTKVMGEEHASVSISLNNLALLLGRMGKFEESERLHLRALDISRRLYGDEHVSVASDLTNLAFLLTAQGRLPEAESYARDALSMQRRLRGEEHPEVASALNNLASVMVYQGDYEAAKPLFLETLELQRKLLGDKHPDVATLINNIGVVHLRDGDYRTAETRLREALALRLEVLGDTHPDIAGSLSNLARALDGAGNAEEAVPLFERAIRIYADALGSDHWRVSNARGDYGITLTTLGRYAQAEEHLLAALAGLELVMGSSHERTQKTVTGLVRLYEAWGRADQAAEYRGRLVEDGETN